MVVRKRFSVRAPHYPIWEYRYVRGDVDQSARTVPPCPGVKL